MDTQMTAIKVEQGLAKIIADQALAKGLSIEMYLKSLVTNGDYGEQEERMSLTELDSLLDELSEGTEHIAPLPPNFSREDIYFDHD